MEKVPERGQRSFMKRHIEEENDDEKRGLSRRITTKLCLMRFDK